MTLENYIKSNDLTYVEFAKRAGVHFSTIWRAAIYAVPRKEIMKAIYIASEGDVEPNDFYSFMRED